MKKLIVTDTHLGIYKSSDIWHNIILTLFSDIHDICIKNNISVVIHGGDFFHDRKAINTKTQGIAHTIANMFDRVAKLYLIVGNHDTYYKNQIDPTSLEFLNNYEHIEVVKEVKYLDNITLCPWGKIPEHKTDYCIGHFELNGFHMNNAYVCEHGMNPNILKDFKHVFSGHFHTPSSKENITYLGSAIPQTFHDVNSPRGYYIFDDETGELKFFEFDGAPKFIKCDTSNYKEAEIEGNVVRLTFLEDFGTNKNQKIIDKIFEREPFRLDVNFERIVQNEVEREEKIEMGVLNHDDIISQYIKDIYKVPKSNFKKKMILNLISKLKGEIS